MMADVESSESRANDGLVWLKAAYTFHSFAYRDPRSAFSSAVGLPVVSPTTVLLGVVSTLFNIGRATEAHAFLEAIAACRVVVDPPDGVVFFRTFHQLRRYHSTTKGRTERVGLTSVNQGTREYGLVQGAITVFLAVPADHVEPVKLALRNRDHVGTHDSLCSLVGDVQAASLDEVDRVTYAGPESNQFPANGITVVTLSRFKDQPRPTLTHWSMAGGDDTELVPYVIKGGFAGTTRGKVYRKYP